MKNKLKEYGPLVLIVFDAVLLFMMFASFMFQIWR